MTSVPRLALANLWMFRGLVSSILAGDANTDAIQRTTTALTIMEAGFKDNVVPGEARAVVNHRLHPAERLEDSASKSSIRRFVITEKAPTRAFSWLKAATTAFTFKTIGSATQLS